MRMKGEVAKVEKYGVTVWSNTMMDELRKDECLCLNCDRMEECPIAKSLYTDCREWDLALAVTRCPKWIRKGE
jgi:hypothetical protein